MVSRPVLRLVEAYPADDLIGAAAADLIRVAEPVAEQLLEQQADITRFPLERARLGQDGDIQPGAGAAVLQLVRRAS